MGGAICQNGLTDGCQQSTPLVKKIAGTPDTYPLIYGDFSQLYVGVLGGIGNHCWMQYLVKRL
jgi:hypothetical protein